MQSVMSHSDVISLWRNAGFFARAIGIDTAKARQWRHRGRIPSDYWPDVAKTRIAKEFGITIERLAIMNRPRQVRKNASGRQS